MKPALEVICKQTHSAKRRTFMKYCWQQLGKPVLWGMKGENNNAFDCSGLCMCALKAIGGPDLRATFNAQKIYEVCLPSGPFEPKAGDFAFYGKKGGAIIHVAVYCDDGRILSASGASSHILTLDDAAKAGASVMMHSGPKYRADFVELRPNKWLLQMEAEQNG